MSRDIYREQQIKKTKSFNIDRAIPAARYILRWYARRVASCKFPEIVRVVAAYQYQQSPMHGHGIERRQ